MHSVTTTTTEIQNHHPKSFPHVTPDTQPLATTDLSAIPMHLPSLECLGTELHSVQPFESGFCHLASYM